MVQLVIVVLTALVAGAGYWEMERFTQERGRSLLGVSPGRWAIGFGLVGLLVAVFAPAFLVGVLAGVVGYHESGELKATWREAPLGVPVPGWAVACAVFGYGGAALTSTALWLVVCGFVALVGALFVGMEQRYALADEKRLLLAENRRLLARKAEKAPLPQSPSGAPLGVTGPSGA